MHARKPPRLSDGRSDRRDSKPSQTNKYPLKSHPVADQCHEKSRDADFTPPSKMLRRSSGSPDVKPGDFIALNKTKVVHAQRPRERGGGTSYSPQEDSLSHSSQGPNSDPYPSKAPDRTHEPADDWSEHISSSGKKYYYNCRTEVSQWEKPKDWIKREQRQREAPKSMLTVNSFPKDRDYRREAMHTSTLSAFPNIKGAAPDSLSSHPDSSQVSSSSSSSSSSTFSSVPSSAAQDIKPLVAFSSSSTSIATSTSSSTATSTSSASSTSSATSTAPSTSSASVPGSSSMTQSSSASLLQDQALLRQLLPALQATLHLNHANVDVVKLNEALTAAVTQASLQSMLHKLLTAGPSAFNITSLLSQAAQLSAQGQTTTQSPMSLPSDPSSPWSYVSPRVSTPHTNAVSLRPHLGTSALSSQAKVNASLVKPASMAAEDPRLQRQNSQGGTSPGPYLVANRASVGSSGAGTLPSSATPGQRHNGFTPSLATHFDVNLIRHVQGWPTEHVDKQVVRLTEDAHNIGTLIMAELCAELKNLRSLVRVSEIQATLRDQRILFLKQQIRELERMQTSYMI